MSAKSLPKMHTGKVLDTVFLRPLVPFKNLIESHLQELLNASSQQLLFVGDRLFEAGQYDTCLYYLLFGELECRFDDGRLERVEGDSNLLPLYEQQPRPCSAVAQSDCTVLCVDRERLDKLLTWSQVAEYLLLDIADQRDLDEDAAWMETVLKSNLFLKVPPTNVEKIFHHMTTRLVDAGEVIIRQGELGDCCYFIKEGQARVIRHPEQGGGAVALADIEMGRCFGEDALLQETVRNASVTMLSDGVLMELQKQDFLELLRKPTVSELSWNEFQTAAEKIQIIDVRTEGEYRSGHFSHAANIPLNLLRLKSRVLDIDKPYLLYCNTGRRSQAAAYLLSRQGIEAQSLRGGVGRLPDSELKPLWDDEDFMLKQGQLLKGR